MNKVLNWASIMEAHAHGSLIQAAPVGVDEWEDCIDPNWNWGGYRYRVKPEEGTNWEKEKTKLICDHICNARLDCVMKYDRARCRQLTIIIKDEQQEIKKAVGKMYDYASMGITDVTETKYLLHYFLDILKSRGIE